MFEKYLQANEFGKMLNYYCSSIPEDKNWFVDTRVFNFNNYFIGKVCV